MYNDQPPTPPIDIAPIATQRLHLRAPVRDDAPALVQLANDKGVASQLASMPHPYGPEDAAAFLKDIVPTQSNWAIRRATDDAFMGVIGLFQRTPDAPVELGYWLGRPYWGAGFATEAARSVIAFGFSMSDIDAVIAGYMDGNNASGRVLEKIGFLKTGRSPFKSRTLAREVMQTNMRLDRSRWEAMASPEAQ